MRCYIFGPASAVPCAVRCVCAVSSSVRTDLVTQISISLTGHTLVPQPRLNDEWRQHDLIEGSVRLSRTELIKVQKD